MEAEEAQEQENLFSDQGPLGSVAQAAEAYGNKDEKYDHGRKFELPVTKIRVIDKD